MLDLLNIRIKAILFIKEIIINFQVYNKEDLSNNQEKKIYDYRQTIKVIKLLKKVQININNQVKFENKDDYKAYNKEQHRHE